MTRIVPRPGRPGNRASAMARGCGPNCPCDDGVPLRLDLTAPDAGRPVRHSREGPSVRGFFLTEYRHPGRDPAFG